MNGNIRRQAAYRPGMCQESSRRHDIPGVFQVRAGELLEAGGADGCEAQEQQEGLLAELAHPILGHPLAATLQLHQVQRQLVHILLPQHLERLQPHCVHLQSGRTMCRACHVSSVKGCSHEGGDRNQAYAVLAYAGMDIGELALQDW